jgi:UDP-N-acetylenolpyruvoylglucosamine reductase
LREQFGRAFRDADVVFVAPIYSAGENPIEGVGPESIVMAAKADGHPSINCVASLRDGANAAVSTLREGDLLLTLGAGNVHEAASFLAEELQLGSRIREVLGPGVLKYSEPLSRHTTMRVGGPARFWVEPETEEGFSELVRFCHDENIPFMVMGRGSNLIVRDGGFPGVVAHLVRGCFSEYRVEGNRITAGVGVKLKQLASTARHALLTGFEWMDGIPGNLGGALRMNAGAMGVQTFEQVESIRFSDRDGNIIYRTVDEMEIQYREIPLLRDHFALSATLLGSPDTIDSIDERLSSSLKHRKESQPIAASSGCIFKNPEGISAGRLIDELGLKNTVHGGARVSDLHANFIVNEGGATASDILELIRWIKSEALERRGIQLETEVSIIGMDKTE